MSQVWVFLQYLSHLRSLSDTHFLLLLRYLNIMEGQPLTEAQCNAVIKKNNVFKGEL
jgi:hypothetical protein